ncbi:MAG: hypothetical protein LBD85_01030 [Oscillospiraceae bacterium]|nr:hypothetical protein [Oscillospiraceae bacterium]
MSKLSVWEERDKAIAAGYEKLNNEVLPEVAVDKEATIGAKSSKKFRYGFKKHVGADMRSGMINRVAITTANVPDKVVDENMNAAQIQQEADTMLTYYNRKLRTLTLDRCIGVPTIRAGSMVMFNIPKLGDINLNSFLLVESAEHYFTNSLHLMDLECKIPIK